MKIIFLSGTGPVEYVEGNYNNDVLEGRGISNNRNHKLIKRKSYSASTLIEERHVWLN